jgi:hypothetical protein
MKKPNSSTPRKAAAARVNGRKGGTKSPDISRWNALTHACSAKKLSITEGKYLPEYGVYAALHAKLIKSLGPGPISVEDLIAVDKAITDAWRLQRSFRFELSETEKLDNGMLSPAMANVLRYVNLAARQFDKSHARIKEIREQKQASALAQPAAAAAQDLGSDQQTPSRPAAADAFPHTAPITVHSEDALEGEEPRQSALPAPSASSEPGNGAGDTPHEAVHSAAAAKAAQPAQSSAAVSSTTAIEEEQKGATPGAG